MNGHTLNAELVEKCITGFQRYGRTVDADAARAIGREMAGMGFDSATEAAECFKSRIWNAGLVA